MDTIVLTKSAIRSICLKKGFVCRFTKQPIHSTGVDVRIARDPRYRSSNRVEVLQYGSWHILGWLWDIETYTEAHITTKLTHIDTTLNHAHDGHVNINIGFSSNGDESEEV